MRILTETLKRLTDQKWINLFEVEYRQPSGNVAKWQFASRKSEPKFGSGPLAPTPSSSSRCWRPPQARGS